MLGLDRPWPLSEGAVCEPGDGDFPCAVGLVCNPASSRCEPDGSCVPETVEVCTYTGPAGTKDVGACHAGSRVCDQDGVWSACSGEVTPTAEDCSAPGDEDCDGEPNDGCPCEPGTPQDCYTGPMGTLGVGACSAGTQTCNDNGMGFGPCTGDVVPAPETCLTAADDDCDGTVNEDGDGCVCTPNGTAACYEGPAGTADVGLCASGTQTCNGQGTGFLPGCAGQVLPATEDCTVPDDEDCDGFACGEVRWGLGLSSAGAARVAAMPDGGVVVFGTFGGTLSVGNINLISAGANDYFLIRFDPQGVPLWGKRFGDVGNQNITGQVLVDGSANITVVVRTGANLDFGGGPLSAARVVGIARFDQDGTHAWSDTYGTGTVNQYGAAMAPDGSVWITGGFSGTTSFGGGTPSLVDAGNGDVFVVKVAGNGTTSVAKRFGDAQAQAGWAIATDAGGNVVFGGSNSGTFGIFTSVGGPIFLGRLDPSGNASTNRTITGTSLPVGANTFSISSDALGGVWVTNRIDGTVDYGSGVLTTTGQGDVGLAHFSSTLTLQFATKLGSAGNELNMDVGVDALGRPILAATSNAALDLGGGVLPFEGSYDLAVARYSGAGAHEWSRQHGGIGIEASPSVAAAPDGSAFVAFVGSEDLGQGLWSGLVLLKIDP